ncbi:serine threonine-protein kinase [Nesidiocoris tenuis]|uniref:Serine threonine-protein kinase n=1 Tax=Nesidiocoris tenuis TaxID=355587 RepID=A0ABN7AVU5_9HEMI|nr:serine threonine-protein kinase [Nesidiocoris tenuis]
MIAEAREIRENLNSRIAQANSAQKQTTTDSDEEAGNNTGTLVRYDDIDHTLVPERDLDATLKDDRTLVRGNNNSLAENLGTMVINSDSEDESTMKRHDTGPGESGKKYRPLFLDHFDKKEAESIMSNGQLTTKSSIPEANLATMSPTAVTTQQALPKQETPPKRPEENISYPSIPTALKYHSPFMDGDFEFLKYLSYEELQQRMSTLDSEMEREIDELRRLYQTKRQPIMDAMDQKRKRQQNF